MLIWQTSEWFILDEIENPDYEALMTKKQLIRIEFVTGMMGTGKTTYIRKCEEEGAKALYVGQICREKFKSGEMAKDANAGAPEYTEKFVRELVISAIQGLEPGQRLIVDGMPRKPSQVRWISEQFVENVHTSVVFAVSVLYFSCEEEERNRRSLDRDKNDQGDMNLRFSRMKQESDVFLRVLEEMAKYPGIPLHVCDTTSFMPRPDTIENVKIEGVVYEDVNLAHMFTEHMKFSDHVMSKMGISMTALFEDAKGREFLPQMHPSAQWARKFIEKAQGELSEALRELPDEWWTLDQVSIRKARVEVIDAWHFLMSASISLGMMAPEFVNTFYGKLTVNWERQKGGYVKATKKKDDDKHVGGVFIPDNIRYTGPILGANLSDVEVDDAEDMEFLDGVPPFGET